jgi:hypothetical protein
MDRELIKLIEENGLTLHGDIEFFAHLVAEREREACAKVCEDLWKFNAPATECAEAIRAR